MITPPPRTGESALSRAAGWSPRASVSGPATERRIRVLIADGHPVVRAGVRAVLAGVTAAVVAEAGNGPAAVAVADEWHPDVVVTEADLPGLAGPALLAGLLAGRPGRAVFVLAARDGPGAGQRLLDAGAAGYALKGLPVADLARALRAVVGGGAYLDPAAASSAPVGLSDRQEACLRYAAVVYTNKEVAARLRVSVKTVETYKAESMRRLGLGTRAELVGYAVRRGWFEDAATPPTRRDP